MPPSRLLFLPGAMGKAAFWQPVADLLGMHVRASQRLLAWPGFGTMPADPAIQSLDELADTVIAQIDQPTALIAQSMGGIVAIRAALAKPDLVTHLVLTATSGGVDVAAMGGVDWRADMRAAHPSLPRWFIDDRSDLSDQIKTIKAPTLLIWGDQDPISPVAVGQHLARLLPHAFLKVFAGGQHDVGCTHAAQIAPLIERHLAADAQP